MTTPHLFTPLPLRGVTLRNRIVVSPMCQYSSTDGFATDWHLVHLGCRAVGGAGAVLTEAAAVLPEGRISPDDLGIWDDRHMEGLARIFRFIESKGAVPGLQLAHAGRKASTYAPAKGEGRIPLASGGWQPVAPSALPFAEHESAPLALDAQGLQQVIQGFADASRRVLDAGGKIAEIHAAHGYLLHEFLSPLSNHRTDSYGGSLENRTRLLREVVQAVRKVWPDNLPLFVRISATDWVDGGWNIDESVELARQLKPLGVDLMDCSSGALVPYAKIPAAPGFQVPFAERIRREADLQTAAVGLITDPAQADQIIRNGQADLVMLAREFLRKPYWPLHAARSLKQEVAAPLQYRRAF
jgi:2,4-dienoyl-CoA reductase-like NADH-dependent reductase (Old Yellow Enzyme family)